MKFTVTIRVLAAMTFGSLLASGCASEFGSEKSEAKVVGSIRPKGKLKPAELPALTKITFDEALKTALGKVPGNVVKAELEIEDGNLQYSFEIVGADRKITEVEIDAGNGQILDLDHS